MVRRESKSTLEGTKGGLMHGILGGVVNAGVRFGSCDSVKSTSGNHRLLLETVKAAEACALWRRRAESHFSFWYRRKE